MKKLSLSVDDLRVDSFETTDTARARGTVVGEQLLTRVGDASCLGYHTCDLSCGCNGLTPDQPCLDTWGGNTCGPDGGTCWVTGQPCVMC